MTHQTYPSLVRRWPGRIAVLVGGTLVLSLSVVPGVRADDGLLDDVTQVGAGATQPVVEPVVQAVGSAVPQPVPQPVQEALEPVVEQVEPAASHAEQAVEEVTGTDRPTHPVEEAVEPAESRPEDRGAQPVEHLAAQAPVTPQALAPGGATSGQAAVGPGHGGPGSSAAGGPRDGQRPSGGDGCDGVDDLPPRAMAASAIAGLPGPAAGDSADRALWDLTNALMHLWVDGDAPRSVEARSADDGADELRAFGLPGRVPAPVPALGTSNAGRMLGVLGLFGLLGLLGLLLAGLTETVRPRTE